jgi:hypothetical protein
MFYMPAGTPHVATTQNTLSIHITFSVERPRVRDVLHRHLDTFADTSSELNRLQPWAGQVKMSEADIASALGRGLHEEVGSHSAAGTEELPFDSWDGLAARSLHAILRTELSVSETEEGFALKFPTFTMKVGRAAGHVLARLSADKTVVIESPDQEFREILFHLVGRNAIRISPAVPA